MPDQVDWRSMEGEASPGRAVGRLLRDQRIARELAIDDVAARLRIRRRYLEAIEQGRFDQLPGAARTPEHTASAPAKRHVRTAFDTFAFMTGPPCCRRSRAVRQQRLADRVHNARTGKGARLA